MESESTTSSRGKSASGKGVLGYRVHPGTIVQMVTDLLGLQGVTALVLFEFTYIANRLHDHGSFMKEWGSGPPALLCVLALCFVGYWRTKSLALPLIVGAMTLLMARTASPELVEVSSDWLICLLLLTAGSMQLFSEGTKASVRVATGVVAFALIGMLVRDQAVNGMMGPQDLSVDELLDVLSPVAGVASFLVWLLVWMKVLRDHKRAWQGAESVTTERGTYAH